MAHRPTAPTADLSAGFTIVETMIVLSVAALILLIVMMAIPALERSSHNNSRRQDVQAILDAVSHYKLNNSGSMPSSANFLKYTKLVAYTKSVVFISGGFGTPTTDGINVYSELPTTTPASETDNTLDRVDVHNYRKCSTNPQGSSTNRGAGFGDVVALYAIETGTSVEPQCQQL